MAEPRKVAVVTGGASGLGLASAKRLLAAGHAVAVWDRNPKALAAEGAGLRAAGEVFLHEIDVTDPTSVTIAAAATREAIGPASILLAAAGGGDMRSCVDYPLEEWRRVIDLNLTSAHLCVQAVLHDMLDAGWGRIILVSSMAGKEGNPRMLAYSVAKAAIIGYVKSMGKELAKTGVIVNGSTPSFFNTPMFNEGNARDGDRLRQE
ncbi:MAG: SDR family NAD(P)-dependent oxidoreductase, partial [Hyphomonadaceae bacterium]